MHGYCGTGIGEECSTQVRRCKRHTKEPEVSDSVSQPQARLLGGKAAPNLPSSPADTAKERHQQKRQQLEKEKSIPKPQAPHSETCCHGKGVHYGLFPDQSNLLIWAKFRQPSQCPASIFRAPKCDIRTF